MNRTLNWYNLFSKVYDLSTFGDRPYRQARQRAIQTLDLQEGDVVVDLFCGTGVNFPYIFPEIGPDGLLIGVDGSAGMLDKARRRAAQLGPDASRIRLLARDLRDIQPGFLEDVLPDGKTPKVLITLALGVFEAYETIFANLYDAMPNGTRFALMEVFAEKGARGAWLLDFVGQADVSRRVWEPLKARLSAYQEEWLPAHFWRFIKSSLVVASGVKER
ncbi:MAG: methyltransferase domain-containing protein [Chloroflexi bacterium]|nr:methyltransferase domain-containing protein [Chloroflexota bacterium]